MGDPSRYPEIRAARTMYALRWLPREIRDDRLLLPTTMDRHPSAFGIYAYIRYQQSGSGAIITIPPIRDGFPPPDRGPECVAVFASPPCSIRVVVVVASRQYNLIGFLAAWRS
eukprot:scaffold20532_cov123-Isochrysis_galbana.AAC.6